MRYSKAVILPALLIIGMGACDDATGPESGGRMEVGAVGDSDGTSGSQSASPYTTRSLSAMSGSAEGTVEFAARIYIQSSAGEWIEVTQNAAERAAVEASGNGGAEVFVASRVDAGSYNRVRVVFEDVEADVTGGITIGLGELLTGRVSVNLGANSETVVEQAVQVNVDGGATSRITIDLNSDAWLSRANADTHAVAESDFESAVRIIAG